MLLYMATVSLIMPTLNAQAYIEPLQNALGQQSFGASELVIFDSESTDGTPEAFEKAGARVEIVPRQSFHHATVRNRGAELAQGDILVFMTQDARPAHPEWLERLIAPLLNGTAAASFARQMPYPDANPLERFARLTNYPEVSRVVSAADIERLGIRAFFFSNSCSAIRRNVFEALDGFPTHTIMNEDMLFAAKLLKSGHRIAYVADAVVEHSHSYNVPQTFRRYFDIGVVFAQAEQDLAGVPLSSEGIRYVSKLFTALLRQGRYAWVPAAFAESAAKWVGVSLGKRHRSLPPALRRRLSLHRNYWA